MLTLRRATPDDIPALTHTQTRAFDDSERRFNHHPEGGGPPGYNSTQEQLKMLRRATRYYALIDEGAIIGGAILFTRDNIHIYLGRIWIDPDHQGRSLGVEAMRLLEAEFPQSRRWSLETPEWATLNHRFYEKCGYTNRGPQPDIPPDQIAFDKIIT